MILPTLTRFNQGGFSSYNSRHGQHLAILMTPSPAHRLLHMLMLACLCTAMVPALAQASGLQDLGVIRKTVNDFVKLNTSELPGQVSFTVGTIDPRLQLPTCAMPEAFLPAGSRLWGNTTVGVRCASATPWTIYVPVGVKITAPVAIATHPLAAGHTLTQADVTMQPADLAQLPAGTIQDINQVIGKTVVSGAPSGQPLRQDMLRAPQVIQQGQSVKLLAKGSSFQVSSEGKALGNATLGQVVSVRTQSGQVINGIARQNGVVEVNF